jgi:copper chaperone CopZ
MTETKSFTVPRMHCERCRAAVTRELEAVERVASVDVDLETKIVTIRGSELDDTALRAAIDEAGYEVVA